MLMWASDGFEAQHVSVRILQLVVHVAVFRMSCVQVVCLVHTCPFSVYRHGALFTLVTNTYTHTQLPLVNSFNVGFNEAQHVCL